MTDLELFLYYLDMAVIYIKKLYKIRSKKLLREDTYMFWHRYM